MNFLLIGVAATIVLVSLPEPEKTGLRGISATPRNGTVQQYDPDDHKRNTKGVSAPSANKQHEVATKAKTESAAAQSTDVWKKTFSPEQIPQWAQVILGIIAAIIALVGLGYLIGQFYIERGGLALARETAQSAERARIAVEDFRIIKSTDGDWFTYRMIVENYGKRPAEIIEQSFTYMEGADEEMFPTRPPYHVSGKTASILHPGRKLLIDDAWFPFLMPEGKLLAYGYFKYLDGFGKEQTTGYGFRCRQDNQPIFVNKPGYNYAT